MKKASKDIPILYEDEQYLVFDKPAGLLVIPTPKKEKQTLVTIVNDQYASRKGIRDSRKLHPCHRLDRDTSGVILFAKGKGAQQLMMDAFKQRKVQKEYIAFAHGRLAETKGEIKSAITHLDKKKFRGNAPLKVSITRYSVRYAQDDFSVVDIQLVTGRTNQIRIHLKEIGNPLVGERKYAFARDYKLKFRRPALHARSLQWRHSISYKIVKVSAQLPRDMEEFLNNKGSR